MTAREMIQILLQAGCEEVRKGKGAHVRYRITRDNVTCNTTVSAHHGRDIPRGTLSGIEKDLEPVLGAGWLKRIMRSK